MAQISSQTRTHLQANPGYQLGVVRKILFLALLLGFLLGGPTGARAAASDDEEVVFGGTYTLTSGHTLDANLVVFGGVAILKNGSHVKGDVLVYGGIVQINGQVDGELFISGGSLKVEAKADVGGDVRWVGGDFKWDDGANIEGEIVIQPSGFLPPDIKNSLAGSLGRRILDTLWSFFMLFAFSALAVVVIIFFPNTARRVAETVVAQPGQSAVVGLLTLVVALPVLFILAITILLSPISFFGLVALIVAGMFGWISLGLETGNHLARAFHQHWTPAVSAGVGTFLMTFVTFTLRFTLSWLCIGWLFPTVVGLLGLGAVILSQFGKRKYDPSITSK